MTELFAQTVVPAVPWSETAKWLFGLVGALGAVWLVFAVVIQAKRLFGAQPPFHEELEKREKSIRKQIYAVENNLRREQQAQHAEHARRIDMLEEQYAEMQRDRIRKWDELREGLSELSSAVSFIRGKLEGSEPDGHSV